MRKKHRNSVFSSSDEEDTPRRSSSRKGLFDDPDQASRRGLFDEDNDPHEDNVEKMIKERQQQKKAHWEMLNTRLNEAMLAVESHKNEMEKVTLQLSTSLGKIEKRNRQLHNAKTLVQSLQHDLRHAQSQLEEETAGRARDREAWEVERRALQAHIDELKTTKPQAPLLSPTTLLGKVWSKKKDVGGPTTGPPPPITASQRPPMFTVPVISSEDEESSDSIAGSDEPSSESDDEDEAPLPATTPNVVDEAMEKAIPIGVSRMNYYMEERMKKEAEKRLKEQQLLQEKSKVKADFENEWAALAQETKELKKQKKHKKPTKANTRIPRQRPASFNASFKQMPGQPIPTAAAPPIPTPAPPTTTPSTSASIPTAVAPKEPVVVDAVKPPLPPEPSEAEMELYRRQQARLHELHESERLKREKAEEADTLRSRLHASIAVWAAGKTLLGMLSTLDQIAEFQGLMEPLVVTSEPESIKKGYRTLIRVIHPDKLRNASVPQQIVANEVFTVVTQAFEVLKQA
ncbi:Aste57867_719 [Aphanomyces stellatus]|uniref:Aste57867_719 protein n=1 Tax=Aphanomyces stellatus TaxID=120398 RepID=A0A485K8K1_9STRA|nr:hypothetical protein As57867_000718 [Aphanomyces stellatus]VFT77943.1 Aste57867_719 [Aphanomyces stellatus]